jgi:elongation factor G
LEVVSGTLRPDITLVNSRTKLEERFHSLLGLSGKTKSPVSEAVAGDIVAVAKLTDARVGDTYSPKTVPVSVEFPALSPPVLSIAITPRTSGDDDRLMTGLHRLQEEDPALSVVRDDETHQTLLSGIGETHLAVVCERLARKYGVEIDRQELKVPYRETIAHDAEAEGRHKKQTGGHGQFAVVHLLVEPLARGEGLVFVDAVVGGAVPRQYIPAVEKGVRRAMRQGGAFGFPVVDVKVTLDDGKFHAVDSSEASFEIAGALAFAEALRIGGSIVLEPISRLEITVPSRSLGDVLGDINTRRARVLTSEAGDDGNQTITALVPTSELSRYATDLRALSGGHGRFVTAHDHYDLLPTLLADKLPRERTLVPT